MRLQIKNFAAIREADIQFDGITVIAGANNAGKSTVGKILFSLFHGFYNMQEKIQSNRWSAISNKISQDIDENMNFTSQPNGEFPGDRWRHQHNLLMRFKEKHPLNENECMDFIETYVKDFAQGQLNDSSDFRESIQRDIRSVFQYTDAQIRDTVLTSEFNDVFSHQANSKRNTDAADLRLTIKDKVVHVGLKDEICQDVSSEIKILHSATYIDDPFIVDNLVGFHFSNWRNIMVEDLKEKMKKSKDIDLLSKQIRKDQTEEITNKLHQVIDGEFVETQEGPTFHQKGMTDDLSLRNLSTGLKSFAIIKRLLEYHNLNDQDVLILDEPEIHLHPEWQLIYAELIVLLQKTFNLTILLTTHSPYFLEAIEVFSEKHGLKKKTKYYLAHMQDDYAVFDDVTDDTARIYNLLAEPFDKLDAIKQSKGWC